MKKVQSNLLLQSIKYAFSTLKGLFHNKLFSICSLIVLVFIAFKFDAGLSYDFYMFVGAFIVLTIVKHQELIEERDKKFYLDDLYDFENINNLINFDLSNCDVKKSGENYYIYPKNFVDDNGNVIKEIAFKFNKTYYNFNISVFDEEQSFILSKDITLEEANTFTSEDLRNIFR